MEGKYLETFLRRVVKRGEDKCWKWDGSTAGGDGGYGQSWDGTRKVYAHRVAYELWVGPIPDGLIIDHLCNNRGCVNPRHLRATTHRENILRGNGMSARHARVMHCPLGHPYDDTNTHITPRGQRSCKACWPIANRKKLTACPQGHPYIDGSYKLDVLNRRRCLSCQHPGSREHISDL